MLIVQNILKFRKHSCIGSQRRISGKIMVRGCVVIIFYYCIVSIIGILGFLLLGVVRSLEIPRNTAIILLTIARFITGVNVGIGSAVAPVYLNEIAPRPLCRDRC